MSAGDSWYIVKNMTGTCDILSASEISEEQKTGNGTHSWGPYASKSEAIARRVGLIRSGKCQPVT